MQRPAIWPTHRLLPLCVLYLNKLVTGLKNVYDKWCEEKLDGCLSAPICPVHFLSTAIPRRFYSEEKERKKENKSCFYSSFSRRMALAQNAVWTKQGKPSCTEHNRKSISRWNTFSHTDFAEFDATGFDIYDDELISTSFKATFTL